MALRRHLEAAWHDASRGAGFEEWDGPVLEALDLFTAKSGAEIAAQLYTFEDKGGRAVALRPEMTPTLARMAGARAGGLPKPIKWYCVPQFFRYEKPQRGRGREFFQWNVDVIGASEPAADAEVIAVALDGLRRLGLDAGDVVLRLNDRRFLRRALGELEVSEAQEPEVLAAIDKLERDPAAAKRLEQLLGPVRCARLLRACERFPLEDAVELGPVLEACRDFGLEGFLEPDFRVVRGLAYYTGPVWEIFDRDRALRSIAGGGRYDRLIASLGGPELPALGFGMGDMVLAELLQEKRLLPARVPRVDAYVIPIGEAMCGPARRVLRLLRERGSRAEAPYAAVTGARLGKALRAADQAGARRAVLVGPEEWAQGSVRVKQLASREERLVRLDELE
jgi:histidyl-tRNA synthetase